MPRRHRVDLPGAIHHVMNRGVARQPTFFTDADRVEFGVQLAAVHERFGVETLAYCLMSNHYHLLVRTPDGGLPAAMKQLGQVYTQHVNDRVGRDGPLFRGRYHSILVTTDAYLMTATRYIHRNALDVADVSSPADYRWSSYRAYLGHRRAPSFLRTDVVLEHFDFDRQRFARFTESDEPCTGGGTAMTVADVLQQVHLAVATDDLAHGDEASSTGTMRTVLVLVMDRLPAGPLRTALADHLAFSSPTAERVAVWRARTRGADVRVDRVLRTVLADLGVVRGDVAIGV